MAGCSIVMLTMLFAWPLVLVVGALSLVYGATVLVVTSPAFPFIILAMLAGGIGSINAALVLWRRYKNPDGSPFTLLLFKWTYIWYAISAVAVLIALVLAGVAIFSFFSESAS